MVYYYVYGDIQGLFALAYYRDIETPVMGGSYYSSTLAINRPRQQASCLGCFGCFGLLYPQRLE